jgi:hypothetical protein
MKTTARLLTCLLAAGLAAANSGCLKCELTLSVRADNSGALDLNYSIAEQAITQIKAMNTLKTQMARLTPGEPVSDAEMMLFLNPDEASIRKNFDPYAVHGIYLEKIKVQSRNARRHVEMRIVYESLARAAKADFFPAQGFSLIRRDDGNYMLSRAKQVTESIEDNVFQDPQALKVIAPLMEGFRFIVKTEVPGRVIKANTEEKGTRFAQWTFDFQKSPKALASLQQQDFMVIFEGKGLNLATVKLGSAAADAGAGKAPPVK